MKSRTVAKAALLAAAMALSLGLSGCITLFPKKPPVQLYRFGAAAPAPGADSTVSGHGPGFNLQRSATVFERAAQSDSILTSSGTETAYLAQTRWVAPAVVLFDEAVDQAFDAAGGPARLVPRGEMGSAGASLKLEVESFEARYSGAKDAAPTVVVRVHALLVRSIDRSLLAERTFDIQKPAEANRVGAIVQAFDAAAADAIGQIVGWTETQGQATATAPVR